MHVRFGERRWETDFRKEARRSSPTLPYLKVIDWGWYYLSTVLDDYSRYIITWRLCRNTTAAEVKKTLDMAIARTGVKHVHVYHRPRLLSDNGPCFISYELKAYLEDQDIRHIRTRVYHPMTQGKIERYHRSMKNRSLLDNYYSPSELEARITEWVDHYNHHRYHEAIGNVTPHDRYLGLDRKILKQRKKTKARTMRLRRKIYKDLSLKHLIGSLN